MSRTYDPPQRPSRVTTLSGTEEGWYVGPGGGSVGSRGNGYSVAAAQQASATSGPGHGHPPYPPPFAATPLRSAAYQVSTKKKDRQDDDADDHDDDNDDDAADDDTNERPSTEHDNQHRPASHPLTAPSSSDQPDQPDGRDPPAAALAEYPYSIYNHGTWSAEDDRTLLRARARGQNWAELQRAHFPAKTANACRKRYERLVERRGIHDYGGRRLEAVANAYMGMRREIWSGLAGRVGMKWEVVEALCMSAGLRTIQSNARSYTNRARRDSRISQKTLEAQAEAVGVGAAGLPPLAPLPVSTTDFGAAFASPHSMQAGHSNRHPKDAGESPASFMPPPPARAPTNGPLPTGRLPPIAPIPQAPWTGHANGDRTPTAHPSVAAGLPPEPPPFSRTLGWRAASTRSV